jgi:hypothetical protein
MIKKLAGYGILLAILLTLSGCDVTSDRSDKPSPDWSRGLHVGVASINQPVALQVDGEGHAHLVWYTKIEEVSKLHYVQLDDQAKVMVDRDLDIPLPYLHRPQLLLDRQGQTHLAWLGREDDPEDTTKGLFHFLLDRDGEALSEPIRLSPPSIPLTDGGDKGGEVEDYQMCLGQEGRIEVFWTTKEGITHLGLDERGEVISPPTLIVPQGTEPSAQMDHSGTIHLAWLQEPSPQVKELYYAAFKPQQVEDSIKGIKLTQFNKGVSVVLRGPVLGLDMEYAYIFWSLEQRGGLEAGTARSYYVSFPLGQPSLGQGPSTLRLSSGQALLRTSSGQTLLTPTLITIPNLEPVYVSSQGSYNYRQLAYPLEKWASDFVAMPSVVEGQRNELAVTLSVKVGFGRKAYPDESKARAQEEMPIGPGFRPQIQLAMAVFTQGKMKGYQIATKTGSVSLRSSLQADPTLRQAFDPSTLPLDLLGGRLRAGSAQDVAQEAASNLHLAWLDTAGFWQYDVYYASTSPEVKAWLNRTSPQDALLTAVELAWRTLSGVALLPLVGFWVIPPLIWIVLFYAFGGGVRRDWS